MSHDPTIMATLELLAERFPDCFSVYEARRRPLKIGIHHDILAMLDGAIPAAESSRALRVYTANKGYRGRLRIGAVRFGLAGEPTGIVTAEQVPQKVERKTQQPINKPKPEPPQRLSLADLREAAQRRKAAAS